MAGPRAGMLWTRRSGVRLAAAAGALVLGACSAAPPPDPPPPSTVSVTAVTTVTVSPTPPPKPSTSTTTRPATWTDTVAAVSPSVVRLDVLACDNRWMGTGFVVGDHLIMTANHVAEDASAITVQSGDVVTTAQVVGRDPATDSALLRTKDALPGKVLRLSDGLPALAEEIEVLGFPLATYQLSVTKGIVSALREPVDFTGYEMKVIVTDTAINGGNSGGPAIDLAGRVVGLVSGKRIRVSGEPDAAAAEGRGYVVPSTDVVGNLGRWRAAAPMPLTSCGGQVDPAIPDSSINVRVNSDDPLAAEIARSLVVHGEAINWSNYDAAWQVFTPAMQRAMGSVEKWSSGLGSSVWTDLAVNTVSVTADRASVGVTLVTTQDAADGHQGQTCSVWDMTYTMVNQRGGWLIDKAKASPGSPTAC